MIHHQNLVDCKKPTERKTICKTITLDPMLKLILTTKIYAYCTLFQELIWKLKLEVKTRS